MGSIGFQLASGFYPLDRYAGSVLGVDMLWDVPVMFPSLFFHGVRVFLGGKKKTLTMLDVDDTERLRRGRTA